MQGDLSGEAGTGWVACGEWLRGLLGGEWTRGCGWVVEVGGRRRLARLGGAEVGGDGD